MIKSDREKLARELWDIAGLIERTPLTMEDDVMQIVAQLEAITEQWRSAHRDLIDRLRREAREEFELQAERDLLQESDVPVGIVIPLRGKV